MKAQFGRRRPRRPGVAISLRRGPTLAVRTDGWAGAWDGISLVRLCPLCCAFLRVIMFVTSLSGWGEEGWWWWSPLELRDRLAALALVVVMVFRFAQVMCRWGRNRLGGSWAQEVCLPHGTGGRKGAPRGVLLPSGVARYRSGRCVGSHLRLVRRRSCPPILALVYHSSRCAVLHCAALRDAVVRDGIAGPLESPTGSANACWQTITMADPKMERPMSFQTNEKNEAKAKLIMDYLKQHQDKLKANTSRPTFPISIILNIKQSIKKSFSSLRNF